MKYELIPLLIVLLGFAAVLGNAFTHSSKTDCSFYFNSFHVTKLARKTSLIDSWLRTDFEADCSNQVNIPQ